MSAKRFSQAGFFNAGKNFEHGLCLLRETTISLKAILLLGLSLDDLKETDSAWEKHIEYKQHSIYVVQIKGPKYVVDSDKNSK